MNATQLFQTSWFALLWNAILFMFLSAIITFLYYLYKARRNTSDVHRMFVRFAISALVLCASYAIPAIVFAYHYDGWEWLQHGWIAGAGVVILYMIATGVYIKKLSEKVESH